MICRDGRTDEANLRRGKAGRAPPGPVIRFPFFRFLPVGICSCSFFASFVPSWLLISRSVCPSIVGSDLPFDSACLFCDFLHCPLIIGNSPSLGGFISSITADNFMSRPHIRLSFPLASSARHGGSYAGLCPGEAALVHASTATPACARRGT